MDYTGILKACLLVGGTGLLIGVLLGLAGKFLSVKIDEKIEKIREALPGNNCGGCGYPGCDGLAEAIAKGEVGADGCPVGGVASATAIGKIMGTSVEVVRKVAFIKCNGDCNSTKEKYKYSGNISCRDALAVPGGGPKSCEYGCLGLGTCASVCDSDAIQIVDGIAVVDREKCIGCGICSRVCPKQLIEMVPYDNDYNVACNSKDKGKDVRAVCSAGCIGCKMCEKDCPTYAIAVEDNLAHIDYSICVSCGVCADKCPMKVIK
ncbi:MAG: RnfABCDGE type electron transport complex subunit B [Clostridiales bacterium]|nr:RnfABCDGE type electron transport complex subunit B [Clostridiales bacterium]